MYDKIFVKKNKVGLVSIENVQINTNKVNPAFIYLLKVNNRNTRKRCETCSELTIKTPEQSQRRRSGVFIVQGCN